MDTLDIAFFATGRSLAEIDNQGKGHNLFKSILSYEVDAWYEYWILKEIFVYIYIHIILYIQYTHYHIHIHIYIIYGKHSPCRNYKLHIPFPNCELHLVCIPSRYPPFSGGNLLSRKDQEPPVSWNLASILLFEACPPNRFLDLSCTCQRDPNPTFTCHASLWKHIITPNTHLT